jgi:hypothetical protein
LMRRGGILIVGCLFVLLSASQRMSTFQQFAEHGFYVVQAAYYGPRKRLDEWQ